MDKKNKEKQEKTKNFDEVSRIYRRAEILNHDIEIFSNCIEKLQKIILSPKSPNLEIGEDGKITTEQDTEFYTVKIYYNSSNGYRDDIICQFSKLELVKECAAVVVRASLTARTKKENELNELPSELRK